MQKERKRETETRERTPKEKELPGTSVKLEEAENPGAECEKTIPLGQRRHGPAPGGSHVLLDLPTKFLSLTYNVSTKCIGEFVDKKSRIRNAV